MTFEKGMVDRMQYGAAIFAGIAASAIFWLIDKYLLTIPDVYRAGGMLACFFVFGGVGYWLASRAPDKLELPGTRIASGLRGRNIRLKVDHVDATGSGSAEITSNLRAKGDIEADVSNIEIRH